MWWGVVHSRLLKRRRISCCAFMYLHIIDINLINTLSGPQDEVQAHINVHEIAGDASSLKTSCIPNLWIEYEWQVWKISFIYMFLVLVIFDGMVVEWWRHRRSTNWSTGIDRLKDCDRPICFSKIKRKKMREEGEECEMRLLKHNLNEAKTKIYTSRGNGGRGRI